MPASQAGRRGFESLRPLFMSTVATTRQASTIGDSSPVTTNPAKPCATPVFAGGSDNIRQSCRLAFHRGLLSGTELVTFRERGHRVGHPVTGWEPRAGRPSPAHFPWRKPGSKKPGLLARAAGVRSCGRSNASAARKLRGNDRGAGADPLWHVSLSRFAAHQQAKHMSTLISSVVYWASQESGWSDKSKKLKEGELIGTLRQQIADRAEPILLIGIGAIA